jgi:hypothetical protein
MIEPENAWLLAQRMLELFGEESVQETAKLAEAARMEGEPDMAGLWIQVGHALTDLAGFGCRQPAMT